MHNEGENLNTMTIDQILLNVKSVSFTDLVCQNEINSEEEKNELNERGYQVGYTRLEFESTFPGIESSCVWYAPSISCPCLYFNRESLAALSLYLWAINSKVDNDLFSLDRIKKAITTVEQEAANGDYMHSLLILPDAMRLEFFKKILEKKKSTVENLYNLFVSFYTNSDYGFNVVDRELLEEIITHKSETDQEKTKKALEDLPEELTVYRGGNSESTFYLDANSWTTDINVAYFFACRLGNGPAHIAKATVKKNAIIEYLNDRSEAEVLLWPDQLTDVSLIELPGFEFLEEMLPKIKDLYIIYAYKLSKLSFARQSGEHGTEHELRVLMLCLLIAEVMGLPPQDKRILAEAAIYHDTRRDSDGDDPDHGRAASEYYRESVSDPNELVEFLCEYHSKDDKEGFAHIRFSRKLSKNRSKANVLYSVFKDADALDRVRFSLRDLDINYLRTKEAKSLVLVAELIRRNLTA